MHLYLALSHIYDYFTVTYFITPFLTISCFIVTYFMKSYYTTPYFTHITSPSSDISYFITLYHILLFYALLPLYQ